MTTSPNSDYKYYLDAILPADHPTYIARPADEQLLQSLKNGEYCYVLNSRQTGKSSLMLQVIHDLQPENTCVKIYLPGIIVSNTELNQFYKGILKTLIKEFELTEKIDENQFWEKYNNEPPEKRLSKFIETILLVEINKKIFIFIDEIDSVCDLKFSADGFFELLNECQEKRKYNPNFERLTFAIFGVAIPRELIKDEKTLDQFLKIGKVIELTGFSDVEIRRLLPGIEEKTNQPRVAIQEVRKWTNGQPFLTQQICKLIQESSEHIPPGKEAEIIENLVRNQIINKWKDSVHLKTVEIQILSRGKGTNRLLEIYKKLLIQGELADDGSLEQLELRISGLVVRKEGKLKVNNKIYESIFNLDWVEKIISELRPYETKLRNWLDSNNNSSYLLLEEELQKALIWAIGRELRDEDLEFLRKSISKDRKIVIQEKYEAKKLQEYLEEKYKKLQQTSEQNLQQQKDEADQEISEISEENKKLQNDRKFWKRRAISLALFAGILAILSIYGMYPMYNMIVSLFSHPLEPSENFSRGQRILFPNKEYYLNAAQQAFNTSENHKYDKAIDLYKKAVDADPNNPEALIYFNNAKALAKGNYETIAVVIPEDYDDSIANEILRGIADAQEKFSQESLAGQQNSLVITLLKKSDNSLNIAKQVAELSPPPLGVIAFKIQQDDISAYNSANLILISPSNDNKVSTSRENKFFTTTFTSEEIGLKIANYVKLNKSSGAAIFYASYSESSKIIKNTIEKNLKNAKIKILPEQRNLNKSTEMDFDESINTIKKDNKINTVILLPGEDQESRNNAIKIAKKLSHLPKIMLFGNPELYHPQTLIDGGFDIKNLILAVPWTNSSNNSYGNAGKGKWKGDLSWRSAMSYDAAIVLIEAIKKINPKSRDNNKQRQEVIDKVKETNFDAKQTSGDGLQFSDKGERLVGNQNSKLPYFVIVTDKDDQEVCGSQNVPVNGPEKAKVGFASCSDPKLETETK